MGGSFWLCGVIIFLCLTSRGGSSTATSVTASATSSSSVTSSTNTTLSSGTPTMTSSSISGTPTTTSSSISVTSSFSNVGTITTTPTLLVVAYSTSASIAPMENESITVTSSTDSPTTQASKGTEFWEKAIDFATPLGTFIIVVASVGLLLIFLIALVFVCCKYRRLKKKTGFPDHMSINDSEWMRSNNDLVMWERNLRASEVKTNNGISNRPFNEKRD